MRIATYNVEWFDRLFDDAGKLLADNQWSARYNITRAQQIEALGIVFSAIDADAVMIIEAPDHNGKRTTVRALERFASTFKLRARKVLIGFGNNTQQEIALLYDPDMMTAKHDPIGAETGKKGARDAPRFDGVFRIDLDVDATEDLVNFSKPPLEVAARTKAGVDFRMIGVHLKSKAPHGARNADAEMRLSIANRRKQLAQAIWVRQRIDGHLERDETVVLLGDLNDGPGLDVYEDLFGRSSVEIILGNESDEACLFDPNAQRALTGITRPNLIGPPTSARFYNSKDKRYFQALLDYVMVSADLNRKAPKWRIWHPFDDPDCWEVKELHDALIAASDHYPVTIDIEI